MHPAPDRAAPTRTEPDDDALVRRSGYRPRLARTLGRGEAFGVGFSFISVTTGSFTTFGFLLSTAGPRGIWTWPVAVLGQTLGRLHHRRVRGIRHPRRRNPAAPPGRARRDGPGGHRVRGAGDGFLVALAQAIPHPDRITGDTAPVASILRAFLGGRIELFLAFICVAIYACGTVILATASRTAWAMARDHRLPAHRLLARVPRASGGPPWATLLVAGASGLIVVTLGGNPDALTTLFTASTLMPAILYTATVLLYLWATRRGMGPAEGATFRLGAWQGPVVAGALAWLGCELLALLAPARFRPAQTYALAAVALGAVVYLAMRLAEPAAMTRQPPPVQPPPDPEAALFGEQPR